MPSFEEREREGYKELDRQNGKIFKIFTIGFVIMIVVAVTCGILGIGAQ